MVRVEFRREVLICSNVAAVGVYVSYWFNAGHRTVHDYIGEICLLTCCCPGWSHDEDLVGWGPGLAECFVSIRCKELQALVLQCHSAWPIRVVHPV